MPSQYFGQDVKLHEAFYCTHFSFFQFIVKLLEEFDIVLAFRRISHSWASLA